MVRRALRISVLGSSGAGKSTLARTLAMRLGCRHIELDAHYHQPGWTALPDDAFRARIAALVAEETWVCDGGYRQIADLVARRATDVVWLDPPRWVVMAQVIGRSFERALTGQVLWNGNRERFASWVDSGHPIRWAWANFDRRRTDIRRRIDEGDLTHVRVHHLRNRRGARALVEALVRV